MPTQKKYFRVLHALEHCPMSFKELSGKLAEKAPTGSDGLKSSCPPCVPKGCAGRSAVHLVLEFWHTLSLVLKGPVSVQLPKA